MSSEAEDLESLAITADTIIASIALIFSAIAVGVSVYQALLNRPRVRVKIQAPMFVFGYNSKEGPYFLVSATNVGSQPTTLTNVGMRAWDGSVRRVDPKNCVFNAGGYSVDLPHKLLPGEEAKVMALISDEMRSDFLSRGCCEVFVDHTWASSPIRRKVAKKVLKQCVASA